MTQLYGWLICLKHDVEVISEGGNGLENATKQHSFQSSNPVLKPLIYQNVLLHGSNEVNDQGLIREENKEEQ